ncbi:hypothetical protein V3C99_002805 [Haemonchus contortus]
MIGMKAIVVLSLVALSASSDSESREKLRQVEHPPILDEQHPDVAVDSIPNPSQKSSVDLGISFYHGFLASLSVIIVSELGDKTWFIAVIMAMRHSRLTVFSGAMAALALMTVLSACLGWVTQLIPRKVTYYVSTALFALFGLKMLHEGYHMSASEGQEEFEEAQAEVAKREMDLDAGKFIDMEAGNAGRTSSSSAWLIFSFASRIFIEAFTMTFVAEWGDRSQLTTIILAARENIGGVISGGILGHAFCTGIAVVGGKLVAQRISVRTVTLVGGVVFLIFALSSLFISDPDESLLRVE